MPLLWLTNEQCIFKQATDCLHLVNPLADELLYILLNSHRFICCIMCVFHYTVTRNLLCIFETFMQANWVNNAKRRKIGRRVAKQNNVVTEPRKTLAVSRKVQNFSRFSVSATGPTVPERSKYNAFRDVYCCHLYFTPCSLTLFIKALHEEDVIHYSLKCAGQFLSSLYRSVCWEINWSVAYFLHYER